MPSNGLKTSLNQLNYEDLLNSNSDTNFDVANNKQKTTLLHQTEHKKLKNIYFNNNDTNKNLKCIKSGNTSSFSNVYNSKKNNEMTNTKPEAPFWIIILTYLGYLNLFLFGCLRDFLRNIGIETKKTSIENNPSVIFNNFFKMI